MSRFFQSMWQSKWIGIGGVTLVGAVALAWALRPAPLASLPIATLRPEHPAFPEFPTYDFIRYEDNRLQFPGDRTAWDGLFQHLDQLVFEGDTTFSVLHMGGSHVQAGTLSNALRERLLTLSDGIRGERGFIFPFRLARTNGPRNLKVEYTGQWDSCKNSNRKETCDWGLSGYNAWTADTTATVKLWSITRDSVPYAFNRVRIFHDTDTLQLWPTLGEGNPVVNVTVDVALGCTTFELAYPCDTLWVQATATRPNQERFTLRGIYLENDDYGLTYNAVGVNGASVPSYLRCPKLPEQVAFVRPDLVILGIGINDAYMPASRFSSEQFGANYDSLLAQLRTANPHCQLLFLTNNDSKYKRRYPNKNADAVRSVMLELAKKYDGAVWDLYGIMGGLGAIDDWKAAGLAKSDGIHFTPDGYTLQADLMFHAIRDAYAEYLMTAVLNSDSTGTP